MSAWVKEVSANDIQDGADYFLAKRPKNDMQSWYFYAENRAGEAMMSIKPGIAIRVVGNDKLRELLRNKPDHAAIAIPADADSRWRARRISRKGATP